MQLFLCALLLAGLPAIVAAHSGGMPIRGQRYHSIIHDRPCVFCRAIAN